jgi:capsular exopolysaccharide synthesis family protein
MRVAIRVGTSDASSGHGRRESSGARLRYSGVNTESAHTTPLTIRDYLGVVRRWRGRILIAMALTLVAAATYSLTSEPRYAASAQVLVGLADAPRNTTQRVAPERINDTQAALAHTTEVARRTLSAAGVSDLSTEDFLASSKVVPNAKNDVLIFRASDGDKNRAITLATEFARQFILYRRDIDDGAYVDQVGDAFLVASAREATKTDPEWTRNLLLGLALGLIAGTLLAFLSQALDTRVRSAADIVRRLDLPLLGRLPKPPRKLRRKGRLVMFAEPNGPHAEPFRTLRTNLLLLNAESDARTVMVTSAVSNEGKSTTSANLAVALARMGKRVILADLDMRRPSLARLFALDERRFGVTEVLDGRVSLDAVLAPISVARGGSDGSGDGSLHVLPAGSIPANVGEFFANSRLSTLLMALTAQADIVLIDGPPLLGTGDGVTLASEVQALVVVARVDETRRAMLDEVHDVLAMSKVEKLGVIVTSAPREMTYRESLPSAVGAAAPESRAAAGTGASNGVVHVDRR